MNTNNNNCNNIKESSDLDEMITPIQIIPFKKIIQKNFGIMRGIKSLSILKKDNPIKHMVKHKLGKSYTNNVSRDSNKRLFYKSTLGMSTICHSDNLQDSTGNDHLLMKSMEIGAHYNLLSITSNNDSISHINHSALSKSGLNSRIPTFQSNITERNNNRCYSQMYYI